jgi:Lrp/AsnC family leucine-responsive transcriptional regulator
VDDTDRKILRVLQQDSRLQFAEIGKKVNLSAPAVFARVKKMEKQKIIRKFGIEIDPATVDANLCAFIRIVVKGITSSKVVDQLTKFEAIEEAHHVAGEDCLVLKVRVPGAIELNNLLEKIKNVEGVERTVTSVVLKSAFERGLVL